MRLDTWPKPQTLLTPPSRQGGFTNSVTQPKNGSPSASLLGSRGGPPHHPPHHPPSSCTPTPAAKQLGTHAARRDVQPRTFTAAPRSQRAEGSSGGGGCAALAGAAAPQPPGSGTSRPRAHSASPWPPVPWAGDPLPAGCGTAPHLGVGGGGSQPGGLPRHCCTRRHPSAPAAASRA